MISRCRVLDDANGSNDRQVTQAQSSFSTLFNTEIAPLMRHRIASTLDPQPLLTIFDLERLNLHIVAALVSHIITGEPSVLRIFWYKQIAK